MARIRTIKPEFFTSLTIADLPDVESRLTFIGLWTHVDDDGRCVDDARLVKAAIWPLDDRTSRDVEADLNALTEASLITRYKVGDRSFIQVTNWREHQKINRPTRSKFPSVDEATEIAGIPAVHHQHKPATSSDEGSPNDHGSLAADSVSTHGGLTGGKEQGTGNREQGTNTCAPQAAHDSDPSLIPEPKRAPKPGSDDDPDWLKFWATYPLKKSKDGARKSWASALKKASAEDIIAGAERYRDDPSRKPEYTKHPPTWLNNGCWADEPTPTAPHSQGDWRDVSGQDYSGWDKQSSQRNNTAPQASSTGWNQKGTDQ